MSGPIHGIGAMPDGCSGVTAEELGRVEGGWSVLTKSLVRVMNQACLDEPYPFDSGGCNLLPEPR
jgi:hypothetical protein